MNRVLKIIFNLLIVRPIVLIVLGLNIRGRHNLPQDGPAVIVANHNSHLDTMVLFSLFPLSKVHKLRPLAAADYFLRNKFMAWFSLNIIGIIPIARDGSQSRQELFAPCHAALDQGDIIILFPEGTRGEPEQASRPKKGIFHLVKDREDTPVIPVVTHGLGRALPRGEALFVPFNCDVVIGEPLPRVENSEAMLENLALTYETLLQQCLTYNKTE